MYKYKLELLLNTLFIQILYTNTKALNLQKARINRANIYFAIKRTSKITLLLSDDYWELHFLKTKLHFGNISWTWTIWMNQFNESNSLKWIKLPTLLEKKNDISGQHVWLLPQLNLCVWIKTAMQFFFFFFFATMLLVGKIGLLLDWLHYFEKSYCYTAEKY